MDLKAVYTVAELGLACGMTVRAMRHELRALKVPLRREAGRRSSRVYLSDLLRHAPDLVQSLRVRRSRAQQ